MFGEAGETTMAVITMIAGIVIVVFLTVGVTAYQTDEATTAYIKSATEEFLNESRTAGEVTQQAYDSYIEKLGASGHVCDVQIVIQQADGNITKKENSSSTAIGDNIYYTSYDTQIQELLAKNGVVSLNEGDLIWITVDRTDLTIFENLRNKITGNSDTSSTRVAEVSGMVTTSGN